MLAVTDLAEILGVGRTTAYELCRRPGFPAIKIGKQIRIPREALMYWIDGQSGVSSRQIS